MPTYRVTDPQTGKTVRLTGDSPPTEDELTQVFASLSPAEPPSPATAEPARTPDRPQGLATIGEMAGDVLGGLRSSAARTVYGGGDYLRRGWNAVVPESMETERIIDTPEVQAQMQAPDSRTGQIASFAGDVGQFFLPTNVVGKGAKLAEIAKAGALTLAQTRDPLSAGVSAGLTAAIPGAAAIARQAPKMRAGAEKSMAQALGATKEWAKDTAAKVAPGMLDRGVKGSRVAMLEQAKGQTRAVGQQISNAIAEAAKAGQTIDGNAIRDGFRQAASTLFVADKAGKALPIEGAQGTVKALGRLDDFVARLGPDIPIDKAAKVKTAWDHIVSKAGLYGPKATASATDNANAWAIREGASGFRDLIAKGNPTLAELNQEYAFWKGLRSVLAETERRTQAQGGGLVSGVTGSMGAVTGFASGDSMSDRVQNAVIGGVVGRQLVRVLQSPEFRTRVSGPLKDKLADALASGKTSEILGALGKITASIPGQLSTSTAGAR